VLFHKFFSCCDVFSGGRLYSRKLRTARAPDVRFNLDDQQLMGKNMKSEPALSKIEVIKVGKCSRGGWD